MPKLNRSLAVTCRELQSACAGGVKSTLRRRGATLHWIIGGLTLLVAAGAAFVPGLLSGTKEADADQYAMTMVVKPGEFEHSVIEPGEIESSNNVEVRCEVRARGTSGTTILEIIPAGTVVQPGDVLIKFDSSAFETELTEQQIVCNNSKALLIQSQNVYDTALIAKQEYINGLYKQEEQLVQSEVFVAEEGLRRAEEYARYSERLAARGYVTAVQVEADKFAVEKARKDVEAANTKLKVLQDFTRAKFVNQLDAAIKTAEAKLDADKNTHKLDVDNLKVVDEQIKKCIVRAPSAGKVVYANIIDRRGSAEVLIEEGAVIRERQVVIRLPDLNHMQVVSKINESRVGFVQKGMPATVRLEAFPDLELDAVVTRVDEYPVPPGYTNIKQYAAYVQIHQPPEGVRPGLTAQVEIHVDMQLNALTVPVQAIHEHKGAYYCLVRNQNKNEARLIEIGSSNEGTVVVTKGLASGDEVIVNPDRFAKSIQFPAPPPGKNPHGKKVLIAKANADAQRADGENQAKPDVDASKVGMNQLESIEPVDGSDRPEKKSKKKRDGLSPSEVAQEMLTRYDANKDGILQSDEIPAERREWMSRVDTNSDGEIDSAELAASTSRIRVNPAEQQPAPPENRIAGGGS
ncbi:MAG: HlyD family efflux transporter periplasmic adaptor subunit [Planctomycetota bacterium]|nr:HlyD family efflux transporter periplasmic adaptor subunit [Planctomycetota bacterium]